MAEMSEDEIAPGAARVALSRLGPEDWRRWRLLRRAALAEAPDAFTSTLEDWSGERDVEERWRQRLRSVPLNLVAQMGGHDAGMVSATAPEGDEVELLSLWVAPEARGRGLAGELIEAVAAWASAQGGRSLVLEVREHNAPAVALYRRHGFREDDQGPRRSSACELQMRRPLTPAD